MDPKLPPAFERNLNELRGKGRTKASLAATLEKRYLEAKDDETRARAAESAEKLLRSSPIERFFVALIAFPLLLLGWFWLDDYLHASKVRSGDRAVAEVQRLGSGFCWFGGKKSECVEIDLLVHPKTGASFDAQVTYSLPQRSLPRVQPGNLVYVSIQKDDAREVLLDTEALGHPAPQGR